MQFATGSYTGNGDDNRSIAGVGFQPDLMIIKGDGNMFALFCTSTMDVGDTAYFTLAAANIVDAIQALEADGFQIGTNISVNNVDTTYHYAAFRDNGETDFHVGTYTGNGEDNRSIENVGFQPTVVWLKQDDAEPGKWRVNESAANRTLDFNLAATTIGSIKAFEVDGFQIGTRNDSNEDQMVYHYVAFKDVAGYIETGTYAGDGNDDRSIGGAGFQPDLVFVKSDIVLRRGVLCIDTMDAGDSGRFTNVAPTTNMIQALEADGFQIGTADEVNVLNDDYYWAAWKTGTTGVVTAALPILSEQGVHSLVFGGVTVR